MRGRGGGQVADERANLCARRGEGVGREGGMVRNGGFWERRERRGGGGAEEAGRGEEVGEEVRERGGAECVDVGQGARVRRERA
jgi:hypothetical protein